MGRKNRRKQNTNPKNKQAPAKKEDSKTASTEETEPIVSTGVDNHPPEGTTAPSSSVDNAGLSTSINKAAPSPCVDKAAPSPCVDKAAPSPSVDKAAASPRLNKTSPSPRLDKRAPSTTSPRKDKKSPSTSTYKAIPPRIDNKFYGRSEQKNAAYPGKDKKNQSAVAKPATVPKEVDNSKLTMKQKYSKGLPYYLFFNNLADSPKTAERNTIKFSDLFCPSFGMLKCSLHLNYLIDIHWLMQEYKNNRVVKQPLTLIYDRLFDFESEEAHDSTMLQYKNTLPNFHYHKMTLNGKHQSRIGMYLYKENQLRIIVTTANLDYKSWHEYNQGTWISPSLPRLDEKLSDEEGDSQTNFKKDLLYYLKSYDLEELTFWIETVKRFNFSNIKVFLITSIPGYHDSKSNGCPLPNLQKVLKENCTIPENEAGWMIIAQTSSLGRFDGVEISWLKKQLLATLQTHVGSKTDDSYVPLCIVYPSNLNVQNSYHGPLGCECLSYLRTNHSMQWWLKNYMYEWKSDILERTRAPPYIKSYCRISPCNTKLAYFFLTSGNLIKSAWGRNAKKRDKYYTRSYQAGVLFLPKFFRESFFALKTDKPTKSIFPFLLDLPLTKYGPGDDPWAVREAEFEVVVKRKKKAVTRVATVDQATQIGREEIIGQAEVPVPRDECDQPPERRVSLQSATTTDDGIEILV